MNFKKKIIEDIQIIGMFILIIGLSVNTFFEISYQDPYLIPIWIVGGCLTIYGYTLNWLHLGANSFIFWQNVFSYSLFALLLLSFWMEWDIARKWLIYAIAVFGSLGTGYQLAKRVHKFSHDKKNDFFDLSSILLLASTVLFIVGALMFKASVWGEKLIIAGIVLFLGWGISVRRVKSKNKKSIEN